MGWFLASPTGFSCRSSSVHRKKVGSTSAILNYVTVRSNQLGKLGCQKCRTSLDVCQPSVNHPYQFLAVCPTCAAWFRVEIRPGDLQGVMISLPEVANLIPNGGAIPNPTT